MGICLFFWGAEARLVQTSALTDKLLKLEHHLFIASATAAAAENISLGSQKPCSSRRYSSKLCHASV
jgi:hypothetical protein